MTLDELIALNEEIRALVRSGVPLDAGLVDIAREWPSPMRGRFEALAERLQSGQDLAQALSDPALNVPPVYAAVVAAGQRAGRLEVALEGVAHSARMQADLRRQSTTAMLYPVILLFLSYGVLVLLTIHVLPVMLAAHEGLLLQPVAALPWVNWLRDTVWYWVLWPPVLAAACVGMWSWRAFGTSPLDRVSWAFRMSPVRARQAGTMATFAEVLALLVDHHVPMAEAVVLAADASGGRELKQAARDLSEQLKRGEILKPDEKSCLPGWITWLVGTHSPRLSEHLRIFARQYRDEAVQVSQWITQFAPIIATGVVGGAAVLGYGLMLFVPFTQLMGQLGQP